MKEIIYTKCANYRSGMNIFQADAAKRMSSTQTQKFDFSLCPNRKTFDRNKIFQQIKISKNN